MTATEQDVRRRLREWICQSCKISEPLAITDKTQIIEQRIITSVQVMDLILFIESLRDQPIEVESLKPGAFSDVDSIYNSFFEGACDETGRAH